MTGGLIDIVTYGAQDLYLTGTPQITHFKVVYRRNTNFSMESIEVAFNDEVGFGKISHLEVPLVGDLIHKAYLKIDIPEINLPNQAKIDFIMKNGQYTIGNLNTFNLQTVASFIALNTEAYRQAYTASLAENDTSISGMKTAINNVFNTASFRNLNNGLTVCVDRNVYNSRNDMRSPFENPTLKNINDDTINNFKKLISGLKDSNGNLLFDVTTFSLLDISEMTSDDTSKSVFLKKIGCAIKNTNDIYIYFQQVVIKEYEEVEELNNTNYKFAWVQKLGHAIIDYIDIDIGGEHIDRHYGDWINIWYELAGKKDLDEIYQKMIGNVPELTTFDNNTKPKYSMYIPLQFWFNRYNGSAIPLIAMEYTDVLITVKLKSLNSCAYIENANMGTCYLEDVADQYFNRNRVNVNMTMLIDYIYLDGPERRKFAQVAHEYLIDQIETSFENQKTNTEFTIKLDFNYPVKEMIWVAQKQSFVTNDDGFTESLWWNYGVNNDGSINPISFSSLTFNGYIRFDNKEGIFFNYLQPYWFHRNTPADGINIYSFALYPEEAQPSGACNFTRISDARISLTMNPNVYTTINGPNTDTVNIRIYSRRINVLRIIGGYAANAFS